MSNEVVGYRRPAYNNAVQDGTVISAGEIISTAYELAAHDCTRNVWENPSPGNTADSQNRGRTASLLCLGCVGGRKGGISSTVATDHQIRMIVEGIQRTMGTPVGLPWAQKRSTPTSPQNLIWYGGPLLKYLLFVSG